MTWTREFSGPRPWACALHGLRVMLTAWFLTVWFLTAAVTVSAQTSYPPFPPTGFPDPWGGTQHPVVTKVMAVGMTRLPAGQAPYGTDAGGNPLWPISDPPPGQTGGPTGSEPGNNTFTNTGAAGIMPPDALIEQLHARTAKGTLSKEALRPLVESDLRAVPGRPTGRPTARWTPQEVIRMRYNFLSDMQRHARFVFEGNHGLALAVALKWQVLGRLHTDQIDSITMNIARKNQFPSYDLWIDAVVQRDRQFIQ